MASLIVVSDNTTVIFVKHCYKDNDHEHHTTV